MLVADVRERATGAGVRGVHVHEVLRTTSDATAEVPMARDSIPPRRRALLHVAGEAPEAPGTKMPTLDAPATSARNDTPSRRSVSLL